MGLDNGYKFFWNFLVNRFFLSIVIKLFFKKKFNLNMLIFILINWIIFYFSKNWIYFVVHSNTKYYYIYIIFLQSQQKSKRACQIIQQNLIIFIKVQIDQEQSELIEELKGQLNEFILLKRLQETAQHKYYGIRQIKKTFSP